MFTEPLHLAMQPHNTQAKGGVLAAQFRLTWPWGHAMQASQMAG